MGLFDKENAPLDDAEALAHHIETALSVPMPSGIELELSYQVVKRLFDPMILRADNIPDQPCLFVGNHSMAALDGWVLAPVFIKELKRFVRGLGDKFLFASPAIGERRQDRPWTQHRPGSVCDAPPAPDPFGYACRHQSGRDRNEPRHVP